MGPNEGRIVMRNDYKGPGNRPLLRLSRFGGGGVFYVPGNGRGLPHAISPNGKTYPFWRNLQGTDQRRDGVAVTKPIPIEHVRGDKLGFGFIDSSYDPARVRPPSQNRAGFFANRKGGKCPHCGR